jgi:hypothetical protein
MSETAWAFSSISNDQIIILGRSKSFSTTVLPNKHERRKVKVIQDWFTYVLKKLPGRVFARGKLTLKASDGGYKLKMFLLRSVHSKAPDDQQHISSEESFHLSRLPPAGEIGFNLGFFSRNVTNGSGVSRKHYLWELWTYRVFFFLPLHLQYLLGTLFFFSRSFYLFLGLTQKVFSKTFMYT